MKDEVYRKRLTLLANVLQPVSAVSVIDGVA